jgi:hypothetical protein
VLQQWQRGNIENIAIESVEIKGYEMTPSSIQQEMYETFFGIEYFIKIELFVSIKIT